VGEGTTLRVCGGPRARTTIKLGQLIAGIEELSGDVPPATDIAAATADEARKIFKIGVWYNSVEETLQNLGLPPNREAGQRGFRTWETNGKKSLSVAASDSHPMSYCLVRPEPALAK
jgi:hypothetical protein